jgi:hypothetical protein
MTAGEDAHLSSVTALMSLASVTLSAVLPPNLLAILHLSRVVPLQELSISSPEQLLC